MIYFDFLDTMDKLNEYFEISFYTEPLVFVTLIIALVASMSKRKKNNKLKLFPFYFGFFIIRLLFRYILVYHYGYPYFVEKPLFNIDGYLEYFLVMIEILIFMHFFYYAFKNRNHKKAVKFFITIFITFGISRLVNDNILNNNHISVRTITQMFFLEAVLLLISCFLYYLQIFRSPPTLKLLTEPAFFVVTGLFFFLICSLPYSLFLDFISGYPSIAEFIFSIIYIFYILLFLMIIKAFNVKEGQ